MNFYSRIKPLFNKILDILKPEYWFQPRPAEAIINTFTLSAGVITDHGAVTKDSFNGPLLHRNHRLFYYLFLFYVSPFLHFWVTISTILKNTRQKGVGREH